VPKQVELVTALPLTANGKVSKAELRKAAQASADTVDER
jgi:non-ribosomal peptide synthetase component E (peptide arylation enzyme)